PIAESSPSVMKIKNRCLPVDVMRPPKVRFWFRSFVSPLSKTPFPNHPVTVEQEKAPAYYSVFPGSHRAFMGPEQQVPDHGNNGEAEQLAHVELHPFLDRLLVLF